MKINLQTETEPLPSDAPAASPGVALTDTITPLIKINVDAIAFSIAEELEQQFNRHHTNILIRDKSQIIIRKDSLLNQSDYQVIVDQAVNEQLRYIHTHFYTVDPEFCLNLAINVVAIVQDQDIGTVRDDVGNRLASFTPVEPHPQSSV